MTDTLKMLTSYCDIAFIDPQLLIERAEWELFGIHTGRRPVEFDTFVGTGMSGAFAAPLLAHAFNKKCLLVRKPDDHSNHHGQPAVGLLGRRWIFVDDFVSSGRTRARVHEAIRTICRDMSYMSRLPAEEPEMPFQTEYVGTYMYNRRTYSGYSNVDRRGIFEYACGYEFVSDNYPGRE